MLPDRIPCFPCVPWPENYRTVVLFFSNDSTLAASCLHRVSASDGVAPSPLNTVPSGSTTVAVCPAASNLPQLFWVCVDSIWPSSGLSVLEAGEEWWPWRWCGAFSFAAAAASWGRVRVRCSESSAATVANGTLSAAQSLRNAVDLSLRSRGMAPGARIEPPLGGPR